MNKEQIKAEVKTLSEKAELLLKAIATQNYNADEIQLNDLEWYAESISKLAYGTNQPELVNTQMHNLISWCDHLRHKNIKSQFITCLSTFPLKAPEWSS